MVGESLTVTLRLKEVVLPGKMNRDDGEHGKETVPMVIPREGERKQET